MDLVEPRWKMISLEDKSLCLCSLSVVYRWGKHSIFLKTAVNQILPSS